MISNPAPRKSSLFVALEGLDGSGTTTQMEKLSRWLDHSLGYQVHTTCEPSTGPVGKMIRRSLSKDSQAPHRSVLPWLFAADRADHLHRQIEPALCHGHIVITDRYVPSSLAYQSMEIPMKEVYALNSKFRVPHLLIFCEIDLETALSRIQKRGDDREIFEHRSQLERVVKHYRTSIDFLKARDWNIVTVDANASIKQVALEIQAAVRPFVHLPPEWIHHESQR